MANKKFKQLIRCSLVLIPFVLATGLSTAQAADSKHSRELHVGLALALPTLGLSFQTVLSPSRTVALAVGNGAQIQVNFTGDSPLGRYFLLGIGRDYGAGLVRLGIGYKWRVEAWSFHVESSLNIPFWVRNDQGLATLGYLWPLGFGVHYNFQ